MARILVIDDDKNICNSLRRFLELEGYEVLDALNGAAGLKLLEKAPADLVITDIFMPDQDGISTIMELCEKYPAMKIIAISGGGRRDSKYWIDYLELAENLGAHRVFQKPFSQHALLQAIRELL